MTHTPDAKLTCQHCHQPILQPNGIELDGLNVSYLNRIAHLTNAEARIFSLLLTRIGRYAQMSTLIDCLYASDPSGGPNDAASNIRVRVHVLRRKLKPLGLMIETAWSHGYKLHIPQPVASRQDPLMGLTPEMAAAAQ
jgi:DNA-binding response OmpR family regulator